MSAPKPVRWSHLKHMSLSPAHYLLAATEERGDTPPMRLGRLVDSLLFEGGNPIAVYEGRRVGKEWSGFVSEHAGAEIVSVSEYDKANRMADAVRKTGHAMEKLQGIRYSKIPWNWLGRECVSHPDILSGGYITDLKTSVSSEPGRFTRQALRYLYHSQLAFYRLAARSIGFKVNGAYIVAVESSAPFPVTVFEITSSALDAGERACRLWMERLLQCEASGEFPYYTQAIVPIDVEEDFELTLSDDADLVRLAS